MTQPNPQPQQAPSGAQSGAGAQYLNAAGTNIPVVPAGGQSSGSKYGLDAQIAPASVVVGGLLPVDSANPTAEQVMDAFATADPSSIAQIQNYLYKAGFYGSSVRWSDINLGVIRPDDLDAMKKAVTVAAQTGSDLSDYLRRQAAWGVYTGAPFSTGSGRTSLGFGGSVSAGGLVQITKPDPKRIGAVIDSEFSKLLGHKPSAGERAGFIAAYTAAFEKQQMDNYTAQINAETGGTAGKQPISASSVAPTYLPTLPGETTPSPVSGWNLGKSLLGAVTGSVQNVQNQAQQATFLDYLRNGLPEAQQEAGVNPQQLSAQNQAINQRRYAADQAFLALADAPMPGMPGAQSASGNAAASTGTAVIQREAFDPQAYADEWIRNNYTAQAGAHDATNTFSMFLNILKGGMQ